MEDYEQIRVERCNEMIAWINEELSKGMLLDITSARKRIRRINKSIDVICKYVELNSCFLDVHDVIDNQNRIAKLRGEKDALVKLIADNSKKIKEVRA